MTESLLLTVTEVGAALNGRGLRALLGRDERNERWIWLESSELAPQSGIQRTVTRARAAEISDTLVSSRALELAALLPAWRLVRAAEITLGSTVLVSDSAWPAKDVLALSRLAGARWRALGGDRQSELEAEFFVPFPNAAMATRLLPERPDVVLVISGSVAAVEAGCVVCRDMGTIVVSDASVKFDLDLYPDIHRRGLRVKLLSSAVDFSDAWSSLVARAGALFQDGAETRGDAR